MDKSVWEEAIRENANKEGVGPCNRHKRGIYAEERKGISIVERREGRSEEIYQGIAEKGVYSSIKVTSNSTGVLCKEERQKKENGTRLQIPQ